MPLTLRPTLRLALLLTLLAACAPRAAHSPAPDPGPGPLVAPPAVPPRVKRAPAPRTPDPREAAVLDTLRRYREALLAADGAALLALAHPAYHDDAGTPDPADDTTYASLRALVQTRLARSPVVAFMLVPESFAFPTPDRVHVVVLISIVLKLQHGGGRLSHHQYTDRTTLVLSLHGGAWRFLKGM